MKGILLIQLGTPDAPQKKDVGRYLREFLMDPKVISLPYILRFILVNLIILPFRSRSSAEKYAEIWTERGSPLRFHSEDLCHKIQKNFEGKALVVLGMRYGNPSLQSALDTLKANDLSEILVAPLFPQYAGATSGSCFGEVERLSAKMNLKSKLVQLPAFYNADEFIEAWHKNVDQKLLAAADHILFSYHGLPAQQVIAADKSGSYCLKTKDCCLKPVESNFNCYRHHCVMTTERLLKIFQLPEAKTSMAFQSRLGVSEWLQPYVQLEVEKLAKRGVKKLAVFSPSFVADCLETLEEIGLRLSHDFKSYGGEELYLLPSLNSSDPWAQALTKILERSLNSRSETTK